MKRSDSRLRVLLAVIVIGLTASACVPVTPPVTDGMAGAPTVTPTTLTSGALQYQAIRYGTTAGEQYLDLYVPAGTGPFPLVVWYHGGAWAGGNRWDLPTGFRDSLLNAGYAIATADYRLAQLGNNLWPAGLLDAKLAVKYLRTYAGQLHLNGNRIVTSGHSAGGHLAVLVALSAGAAGASLPEGDPSVKGALSFAGPIDIPMVMAPTWNLVLVAAQLSIRWMMGCGGDWCDTTRMQPLTYLDAADPPVKLVFGGNDQTVPASHANVLATKAATVGYSRLTTQTLAGLDHDEVNSAAPTSSFLPWLASVM